MIPSRAQAPPQMQNPDLPDATAPNAARARAGRRDRRCAGRARQRGVALVTSLVILLVTSLTAASVMFGTRLNERAAANMQQKSIVFHAVDSSIERIWTALLLRQRIASLGDNPSSDQAVIPESVTGLDADFDLAAGGTDIDGGLGVTFCGETGVVNGSLDADQSGTGPVGLVFDVVGEASVTHSNARTVITRRGVLTGPRTGRTGSCTAPM